MSAIMRSWLVVVLVVVAATGKVVHAEPSDRIRGRIGADGVAGVGMFTLVGASLRVEQPIARSAALIARAGHLQVRWFENESKELHPLFTGHGGIRFYPGSLYLSIEAGVVTGSDSDGWHAAPSGALTLGGKLGNLDLGLSLMGIAVGFSLGAHLGFDFGTW